MSIRVLVNGASGKMGCQTVQAITADSSFELVGKIGQKDDLKTAIQTTQPDVVVDFTHPSAVFENTQRIIELNAHPVIGTTGLLPEQILSLQALCEQKQLGGIIAPNFSIGAVLLMRYAADAAKYLGQVEIIEYHHDAKEDSPSGTAIKTAELIARSRKADNIVPKTSRETVPGARGALYQNIPIHAIRLPGLMAHEAVIFGSKGETLQLRHDAIHRECFMPGLLLACQKVMTLKTLVYGLEEIL